MKTRAQILKKYNANIKKIADLQKANKELNREHLLFSDRNQQYKEEIKIIGHGKNKREALCGSVHWKEWFMDEDRPESRGVCIERSQIIKIDGEFINGI